MKSACVKFQKLAVRDMRETSAAIGRLHAALVAHMFICIPRTLQIQWTVGSSEHVAVCYVSATNVANRVYAYLFVQILGL